MMSSSKLKKLNQIPVLHVRGDNRTIGFTIGRQFRYMIEDVLSRSEYLNGSLLPLYNTPAGKILYQKNFELLQKKFPEYVAELEGMAEGANVPFHKILLLNLEVFMTSPTEEFETKDNEGNGCSCILSNGRELLLAHNEDIGPELVNNVFILSAQVLDKEGEGGVVIENFSTITYAGSLPGYTMGYNSHGFLHTVNTLCPTNTINVKSPRSFISRALLKAKNLEELVTIMKDSGTGLSDGFCLNACFLNQSEPGGVPRFYSIESGPPRPGSSGGVGESELDILEVHPGEAYSHCNMYLRLPTPQLEKAEVRSGHRHRAIEKHPKPDTDEIVRNVLSDRSDPDFPVYRKGEKPSDAGVTVVTGIFDIAKLTWSIYSEPPNSSTPIAVLPLLLSGFQ